jgi:putative endonuclease
MRPEKTYYVYILASRSRILYVGVTSRPDARLREHSDISKGFAHRYRCHRLVLLERYTHPGTAIAREKQLKRWRRDKKIALIERTNPFWIDLSGHPSASFRLEPTQ